MIIIIQNVSGIDGKSSLASTKYRIVENRITPNAIYKPNMINSRKLLIKTYPSDFSLLEKRINLSKRRMRSKLIKCPIPCSSLTYITVILIIIGIIEIISIKFNGDSIKRLRLGETKKRMIISIVNKELNKISHINSLR